MTRLDEKRRILVIDDEESLRHMLKSMLSKRGYVVDTAHDGKDGFETAQRGNYDFILCDIKMPISDGEEFLKNSITAGISSTIIMMSAYGTVDTAIACMKNGAYDYISKPFKGDEILLVLRKAEEREKLKQENMELKKAVAKEFSFGGMVGKSPRMLEIYALVKKVCDYKTSVLILGESGTGKELIAKALHFNSNRSKGRFVGVNCGAIPENLLESELFGHVRGAFTDASSDKSGLFEQADGGTLFLDEIGELPLQLQVKLLRVLQDEEIRRVGASQSRKVDVRVVSATSRDLEHDVIKGRFREDLFFRLNVFSLTLPPLRERGEDIPLLIDHFIKKYAEKFSKQMVTCSQSALHRMLDYNWPGNVRELENVIERAMILCEDDQLGSEYLPVRLLGDSMLVEPLIPPDCLSLRKAGELLERAFIKRALERCSGNRSHAARVLEISHRGLLYKMKEYEIIA